MSALATLLLGHFRVGALITWLGRSYKLLKTMLSALATLVHVRIRIRIHMRIYTYVYVYVYVQAWPMHLVTLYGR